MCVYRWPIGLAYIASAMTVLSEIDLRKKINEENTQRKQRCRKGICKKPKAYAKNGCIYEKSALISEIIERILCHKRE